MHTAHDTTTIARPEGWRPSAAPADGCDQRFRVELLKFTARGHIECLGRRDFDDEAAALDAWSALARPSRVRARLVATLTQEWVEPAREGSDGVRFAVHRMYRDGHLRREVP